MKRNHEHEPSREQRHGEALTVLGMLWPGAASELVREEYDTIQRHVMDTARVVTEYCQAEDIASVVFVDKTARLAHAAVDEYWRLTQTSEPPSLHFLNPVIPRIPADKVVGRSSWPQAIWAERAARLTGKQLPEADPALWARRDQPVLLFNTCTHSGQTLFWTRYSLLRNGFTDVRTGVYEDQSGEDAILRPDVCVAPGQLSTCVPYGMDMSIADQYHIHSALRADPALRAQSMAAQAAIRIMVYEGVNGEA